MHLHYTLNYNLTAWLIHLEILVNLLRSNKAVPDANSANTVECYNFRRPEIKTHIITADISL